MIGFKGMDVCVGQRWKTLSAEYKAPFDKLALKEKERYKREIELYERERPSMVIMNLHSDHFELFSFANKKESQSLKGSHSNTEYSSVTELAVILAYPYIFRTVHI